MSLRLWVPGNVGLCSLSTRKMPKPCLPQKARTAWGYTLESDACSMQSGKTKVSAHAADVLDREQAVARACDPVLAGAAVVDTESY